jgi:hypothetical protein
MHTGKMYLSMELSIDSYLMAAAPQVFRAGFGSIRVPVGKRHFNVR